MGSRFLVLSRVPARLLVTLGVTLVVSASLFVAQVSYACSMTGRRQSHCCCATQIEKASGAAITQVAPPCCERTIEPGGPKAALQQRDSTAPIAWAPGALLAVLTVPHVRGSQHVLAAPIARGPPNGPPLYARTCRYLI